MKKSALDVLPILAFAFLLPICGLSQINDCPIAEVVCDNGHIQFNPDGPGFDDFADPDNFNGCIVSGEQNSAWYYFQIDPTAPPNLVLGFIIHPDGGFGEDYDWALFGPDVTCGDLGFPIRCSSSDAFCGFCPETGMGMGATDFTEGPGTGDGFVATLVVQPGQGFYLMIDNWLGTSNGFTLEWTDSAADYLNCDAAPPCALSAIAGDDLEACENDQFELNGSSFGNLGNESYSWSGTNGGTSFLSDPDIPNPTVNLPLGFSGTIVFTLTVTEDTCVGTDDLTLIVNPLPTITINPAGPFCENNPPQTLSANPGGGTWGGDATGNTFNPMTAGPGIHTISYTYTNINDCTNTAFLDIEVYAAPDVDINPDPAEFCDSEGSVTLTAMGSGGNPGYSYHWNTPTGMGDEEMYEASLGGAHHVTVTDENGCTNTTVITVVTHANPDVEIMDPGPICSSEEYIQLTANPIGGEFSGNIITWNGEILPNTLSPGTYTVSYTYIDVHDCDGTDYLDITIVSTPNVDASNNGPACEGTPILLFGQTDSTGNISYVWTGPNGYMSNVQNPTDATLGGPYVLQVMNDGCASPPDTTTVILTPMPVVVAENNGPICNGQMIQLLGSTSTSGNSITYAWSGPSGYVSDLQNPTDATAPGIYTLVVTVDNCASAPTMTEVMFSTPPDAMASNGGPYCAGETIQLFGNTNTSGSDTIYTWTGPNGFTSSNQNPSGNLEPGLYQLVINVDGCNSIISSTDVIVHPSPQPMIAGQDTICTDNSTTLDAGSGFSNYLWTGGSNVQTLEIFTSGVYSVTVTDLNNCTGVTSFQVTQVPSLTPVMSGNPEFCEGSQTMLDAGPGFVNYNWSSGETTQIVTVNSENLYTVTVTDDDGCTGSGSVTTVMHPNPMVMIGGSSTYCIGGYTILDAGAGYSVYQWSNDSTTQTIRVSSPGLYTVDVVDQNGCSGSATIMVDESTSLHPIITGSLAFCENGNTTLNAGSGFATYQWSDGSSFQQLTVNMAGTYSVTVSDGQGCSGESSVIVMEVSPPFAQVEPQAELCNTVAGGSVLNLYDLVTAGDMNGLWQDMDGSGAAGPFDQLDFNGVSPGTYLFTYSTNSAIAPCPEVTYGVMITVLDCACPDVVFINPPSLCNGGDILDLSTILNTTETGSWDIIQTPPGINPISLNGTVINALNGDPGMYTIQYALQNQPPPGCPIDFQIQLQVDATVNAGVPTTPAALCEGEIQTILLSDLIQGEEANGSWKETSLIPSQGNAFNAASGTFSSTGQSPGTYTFTYTRLSNGICPDDSSLVTVVIHPLPIVIIAPPEELTCSNIMVSLDANGSASGPQNVIQWSGPGIIMDGNENTLHPNVEKPGIYVLSIINTMTGCQSENFVLVTQNADTPNGALVNVQDPSCFDKQDGSIVINNVAGGTPPYLFSLDHGAFDNLSQFTGLSASNYMLEVEDANGCRWDTVITLHEPPEIFLDAGPDIELELGDEATIELFTNLSMSEVDTLIWSPAGLVECVDVSCLKVNVHTFNTILLSATVFDLKGCSDSDEVLILVKGRKDVYIPTAFSPNGDGINDRFFIMGSEKQINLVRKFQVYTRWGELIHAAYNFAPNDASSGWDGMYKQKTLNPGVFVYAAEVEYIDGLVVVLTGDVTILR